MCGRFANTATAEELADIYHIKAIPDISTRYNIAPGQQVLTIRHDNRPAFVRWGLVPDWSKDEKSAFKMMINARSGTIQEKAASLQGCFQASPLPDTVNRVL